MVWSGTRNKTVSGEALRQHHQGRFAALLADYAVHLPIAKGFPAFDLCWPVLYRFALWKSGPFVIVLFRLVALPFIEQVLFCEAHKNVAPVCVIIKRVLADFRVELEALFLDEGQGCAGGIVVYYDLTIYEFGQGEVVAQLQVRPFGPEVFLIFALRHVGAVFHDKLCVVLLPSGFFDKYAIHAPYILDCFPD